MSKIEGAPATANKAHQAPTCQVVGLTVGTHGGQGGCQYHSDIVIFCTQQIVIRPIHLAPTSVDEPTFRGEVCDHIVEPLDKIIFLWYFTTCNGLFDMFIVKKCQITASVNIKSRLL